MRQISGLFSTDVARFLPGLLVFDLSRNHREDLRAVDPRAVLQLVSNLPIYRWRYGTSDEADHVSLVAEYFLVLSTWQG